MGTDVTTQDPRPPLLRGPRFLAMPIVALAFVLPEPACLSPDARKEPIARQQSALGPTPIFGRATKVSGGFWHSCALLNTGAVVCWGWGGAGQLGNGSSSNATVPVAVTGLSDAVSVSAGYAHACAVRATGQVVCWGNSDSGQLGNGSSASSLVPVAVTGLSDAVSVTAGDAHTCAVRGNGQVVCWGNGGRGQLGNASSSSSPVPVAVTGLSDAVSVSAGLEHTCARRGTGQVVCWGRGDSGQLGDGSSASSPVPVTVTGLSGAASVAAGLGHTCAVRGTGQVVCWGEGGRGQLGNGSSTSSPVPVAVSGLVDGVSVAAGGSHTCAVRGTGQVVCWGSGDGGQLGNGSSDSVPQPVAVTGLSGAVSVAAGESHTCAARSTGEVVCWGSSFEGQLGNGTSSLYSVPVSVSGLSDGVSVSAGDLHTCAVRGTGQVVCWGNGDSGQLGNGSSSSSPVPVPVSGLPNALAVSAGGNHTCAIVRGTGQVVCWGEGGSGQLGDGSLFNSPVPVAVTGLSDVVSVAAGWNHTCAVRATGQVLCWGEGNLGKLGNGSTTSSPVPVAVSGASGARSVSAGAHHTCAISGTGEVLCWGEGSFGQLGNGTLNFSTVPVAVSGLSDAMAVSGGGYGHTCAVRETGPVVCWGLGDLGQLGNGSSVSSLMPVAVSGLSDASAVAGGGYGHTCAIRGTGEVVCWGWNFYGQLGNGSSSDSLVPVAVTSLSNAVSLAAGGYHTCAARGTGEVVCWGHGDNDQIGDGRPWLSTVPVAVQGLGNIACATGTQCASGLCVDGVCCGSTCGGGDPNDCQACSVAAGAATDGVCGPRASGASCGAAPGICETAGVCGGGLTCPGPMAIPTCVSATVPGCPGSCAEIPLRGGIGVEDGITVEFQGGATAGQISVVPCNVLSPPPTGYKITDGMTGKYCWDLKVSANVSYTTPPPIIVCIHYPQAIAANEANFQMAHDDGGGAFVINTSDRFLNDNTICGFAYSLSPFALVEPFDTTGPVFSNVPGQITAYATSTSGAKVTYTLPKAVDAVDGARPVTCSRSSGTTFPVGKMTVTCKAADKTGNKSEVTFTVWVQYQAPVDGTFFLKPIRPNGSSIFRIGRPVPVRFKLTGASGGITNLVAKLVVSKISNSVQGTTEDTSDETVADTDFVFKYRAALKWYAYHWKTTDQTQGTYQLKADLGDGVLHAINVSLRAAK